MVKAHDKLAKNSEKLLKDMGKVRKNLNFGQKRLGRGWFEAAKWLGKRGGNLQNGDSRGSRVVNMACASYVVGGKNFTANFDGMSDHELRE